MFRSVRMVTKAERDQIGQRVCLVMPFDSEPAEQSDVVNIQLPADSLCGNTAIAASLVAFLPVTFGMVPLSLDAYL